MLPMCSDLFEVRSSASPQCDGVGWFAREHIHPGVILFQEDAAVVGPASPDACIECLRKADQDYTCKREL